METEGPRDRQDVAQDVALETANSMTGHSEHIKRFIFVYTWVRKLVVDRDFSRDNLECPSQYFDKSCKACSQQLTLAPSLEEHSNDEDL